MNQRFDGYSDFKCRWVFSIPRHVPLRAGQNSHHHRCNGISFSVCRPAISSLTMIAGAEQLGSGMNCARAITINHSGGAAVEIGRSASSPQEVSGSLTHISEHLCGAIVRRWYQCSDFVLHITELPSYLRNEQKYPAIEM